MTVTRFGPFELDRARRQLRRDGAAVHLGPKAFELLALLVDASPRVVAKAELHERLWPRGVVSDATLVGVVKEVRRGLGDRDRARPVIRTVHRVGYAFEPPVERETPAIEPAVERETPRPSPIAHWLLAGDRRVALASGENIVGRAANAHVFLDHSTVSRRHARILVRDGEAQIEDLGSKNGTRVGGCLVAAMLILRDGDSVTFGQVPLTYRRVDGSPSTVTQLSQLSQPARSDTAPTSR